MMNNYYGINYEVANYEKLQGLYEAFLGLEN
jgi:hypothetical protein